MKPNFLLDGVAMTTKFQHLSEGLMYYDPGKGGSVHLKNIYLYIYALYVARNTVYKKYTCFNPKFCLVIYI